MNDDGLWPLLIAMGVILVLVTISFIVVAVQL